MRKEVSGGWRTADGDGQNLRTGCLRLFTVPASIAEPLPNFFTVRRPLSAAHLLLAVRRPPSAAHGSEPCHAA
jgi:hypothetical protein